MQCFRLKFELRSLSMSTLVYVAISRLSWNRRDRKGERRCLLKEVIQISLQDLGVHTHKLPSLKQVTRRVRYSHYVKPYNPFLVSFLAHGTVAL